MSLKKAVTEKVAAGLILSAILYGCSFIPGFYPEIWRITKNSWIHLTDSTSVPHWLLGILILLSCALIIRVLSRLFRRLAGPSLHEYREDTILGLPWRWDYGLRGLTNLWCFCPVCDTALVYHEEQDFSEYGNGRKVVRLACDHCDTRIKTFEGDKNYLLERVSRQIDRTQRNGDWRKRIREP